MRKNSRSEDPVSGVAFLWDESFLWGVMAYKALHAAGCSFDLVRAGEIRNGCLDRFQALFVPGGWASNKIKALGDAGVDAIRKFVHDGGTYIGFCGGAGLATMDGIGLLPVKRRPTSERVPSFSGRIRLNTSTHPIWQGISEPVFHAWWPSQFVVGDAVSVLATYGQASDDAFSSDVNVGDAERSGGWADLERRYGINLDPKRLLQEPAVVEGRYGKGKVLLSLLHFDSPNDPNGAQVLQNLWSFPASDLIRRPEPVGALNIGGRENHPLANELEDGVTGLIELGRRNFLWFQRNPLLLQWRRGVRGLEYGTLYVMVREITEELSRRKPGAGMRHYEEQLGGIKEKLFPFVDKARYLLVRERFAMQDAHITYERCDDRGIQSLREELFSKSKSYGGLFKDVVDALDAMLYLLYQERNTQR